MSQERFAALMSEFASRFGIDWRGKERHNRAVFRFDGTEVEFRYSADRRMLFLNSRLWQIDPHRDRALCLCLLNINGISRHMATLASGNHIGLRHRIMLTGRMRASELEEEVRGFLGEISHLRRIFSDSQVAGFMAGPAAAGGQE